MKKRAIVLILLLLLFYCAPRVFAWYHGRPSEDIIIDEHVGNAASDRSATVGVGVHVVEYRENHPTRGDYVELVVVATGNSREIISYGSYGDDYTWETVSEGLDLGDDEGVPVYMGGPVRFYGGPRSAEYEYVWVCSNGFLCFNEESTDPYYSRSIPDIEGPNSFVAPFWKDLDPSQEGASITCGSVYYDSMHSVPAIYGFCVSWNNVPDKHGVPHSFQVIMEYATDVVKGDDTQSKIIFQYQTVALNDPGTTIGIENQRGSKGNSLESVGDGQSVIFFTDEIAYMGELTIKVWTNDDAASTDIIDDQDWIRGHNVELEQDVPDPDRRYEIALNGGFTLLMMAAEIGEIGAITTAGFFIGPILVLSEVCAYAAYLQKEAKLLEIDNTHATARTVQTPDSPLSTVVDADFGVSVFWLFTDNNLYSHSLTVTAELVYYTVQGGSVESSATISTNVNLQFQVSGGGGCPTLFAWDGTDYAEESFLDIHAESDVTVQHEIQNTLALENDVYNLQLRELDNYTSHIDQVKLYAVDYEGEWHLCPLTYAYHNLLGKVKHTLRFDDDHRVDLKPTEVITLKFGQPECETAYFIFEINGYNFKGGPGGPEPK
jgi:hypothetical protein